MTEQELQELERALRAASPVPWTATECSDGRFRVRAGCRLTEGRVADGALNLCVSADREDAEAIAAIGNAAGSLVCEVRRLRARVKELEERCERFKEQAEIGDVFLSD